jgi:hypothetical protein
MDYLRASYLDNSDGTSLRRLIDDVSYNQAFDANVVVVEVDDRKPKSATELSGKLGSQPNFMIRKGLYKLMLPKKHDSVTLDMMFNLTDGTWMESIGDSGLPSFSYIVRRSRRTEQLAWKEGYGCQSSNSWQSRTPQSSFDRMDAADGRRRALLFGQQIQLVRLISVHGVSI